MDFWQCSRNAYIFIIPGKLLENHLRAVFFSNPCGQVLNSIKSKGQICPIILRRKRTFPHGLENNHACKWILDNFSWIISMSAFLGNCLKSIYMHGYSPIHVERSQSLLEFHGVRIWECNRCEHRWPKNTSQKNVQIRLIFQTLSSISPKFMWCAFNLMLDWRAMTVTVHLAPWSKGHSLSVQCYDFYLHAILFL